MRTAAATRNDLALSDLPTSRTRECVECGQVFKGARRLCTACRAVERCCEACGKTFKGRTRLCGRCRAYDRECVQCGKSFRHRSNIRCNACQAVQRACADCGKTFTGRTRLCASCSAVGRECAECGDVFNGDRQVCRRCRNVERTCADCGKTFRSHSSLKCASCWWASRPAGELSARRRKHKNTRRARKQSAEVAGPVPASAYREIIASGLCVYCGAPAEHVDHIRPLARGGFEIESNLVAACSACNLSKGAKLLTEWSPDRVAYAVSISPLVAAEYERP